MSEELKINYYVLADLSQEERRRLLEQRAQDHLLDVESSVRPVLDAVRSRGDSALVEFTAQFDGVDLAVGQLQVTEEEFDKAEQEIDANLRAALVQSISNVRSHHESQLRPPIWMKEIAPGVITGERLTPVPSVGLYVPRGKGSFPSVLIMLCVPAVLAQVPQVVVCTPPGPDGSVDAATLVAARLCGISTIFKIGGAQAVAAMAYGTESVPKVEKVLGPGNQYVTAARRLLYAIVDPGPPAGPSESVVLCDENADVEVASRELLVEAEHGEDSAVLLVTHSPEVADAVTSRLAGLVSMLPDRRAQNCRTVLSNFGGVVITKNLEEGVNFVNEYAPEHLRVLTANPFELLPEIRNAGEVLLGENTSISFGNFSIGVNAILPTGRKARAYSCMGVDEFLKRSSFAYVSAAGVESVGSIAVDLATYEGFPAHAEAARYIVERADAP